MKMWIREKEWRSGRREEDNKESVYCVGKLGCVTCVP